MIKKSIMALSLALFSTSALANEMPPLPVKSFVVTKETNTTSKTYPTILKASEEVEVMARVAGTLEKKYFTEGEFVKKGTLLYTIEPDVYQANLNIKKSNYIKAKKDFERAKTLIASKAISPQDFDNYTYLYESSKAALDESSINLKYTKVLAPIDGITGIKQQDIGNLVGTSANNSHLLTITNTNPINAEFSLPKDDINTYLGQIRAKTAKISLHANGKTYEDAKIDFISPVIDSNTDSLLVRVKFDNNNAELIAGTFTKLEVSNLSLGDVFIVPENAVIKTAQATIVFVIDEQGIANPRPVQTGDLVEAGRVVTSGLNVNDEIVISNLAKLRPGTKVQVINKEK